MGSTIVVAGASPLKPEPTAPSRIKAPSGSGSAREPMMSLLTRDGVAKLVEECTYALTGRRCVSRIYSDYGIFELRAEQVLVRTTYGISLDEPRIRTGIHFAR
ncbi:hypothetical protein ACFWBG_06715 [Nocardia salmonicida]|uniref:hypothetical protein n=1 Tax=Nocardia salmonicida TaxID=53431 RepID=UPI00366DD38E